MTVNQQLYQMVSINFIRGCKMAGYITSYYLYSKEQIDKKMPKTITLTVGTTGYEWTPTGSVTGNVCFVIDTTSILTDVKKVAIFGYLVSETETEICIGSITVLDNATQKTLRINQMNYNNDKITFELELDTSAVAPANYTMGLIYQNVYQ